MTPLIKISDKIYAKLETYQPTGSVKDRMIKYVCDLAVADGSIIPGKTTLVEATSGNTGIALAAYAASVNCPCRIIMPGNMSRQRKEMMLAFGATILETGYNDFKGAIDLRNKMMSNSKACSYWCPYQFENPLNVECHFKTTAGEIFNQASEVSDRWSVFVHGAGTGGTMMGVKKYISDHNLDVKCALTTPAESAEKHGIQGINDGADFLLDRKLMDTVICVKTSEAIERMKKFARETGLLVGISSGANLIAAEAYNEMFEPNGIIITILCDRGERYL